MAINHKLQCVRRFSFSLIINLSKQSRGLVPSGFLEISRDVTPGANMFAAVAGINSSAIGTKLIIITSGDMTIKALVTSNQTGITFVFKLPLLVEPYLRVIKSNP